MRRLKPKRRMLVLVICLMLSLSLGLGAGYAADGDFSCAIQAIDPTTVAPGGTVNVGYAWQNKPDGTYTITIEIYGPGGYSIVDSAVLQEVNGSGSKPIPIPVNAPEGSYNVVICRANSTEELSRVDNAFTVQIPQVTLDIKSPSSGSPAKVVAGQSVNVSVKYTSWTAATATIKIGDIAEGSLPLSVSQTEKTVSTSVPIPQGASSGTYSVSVTVGNVSDTETAAVSVVDVIADIKSPTRSSPATAVPGEYLDVSFNYVAGVNKSVTVKLLKAGGATVASVSTSVSATATTKTKTVHLLVPSSLENGKYDLVVMDGDSVLDKEQEAVVYEGVDVRIIEPTEAKPWTAKPGETVTVKFEYTARNAATVDVFLRDADGDVLVTRGVSLSKTTSEKTMSTSLTLPSSTANGKYALAVKVRASGVVLDEEKDAVLVDNLSVNITSPLQSRPAGVVPGGKLTVDFEYTASTSGSVTVKLVDSAGRTYGSADSSLARTSAKRSQSVTVTVSLRIPGGRYDVVVVSKTSGAALDTEEDAVVVEGLEVEILSPQRADAASLKPGATLTVRFRYTADDTATLQFKVLNQSGSTVAASEVTLSRSTTSREQSVAVTVPFGTAAGKYDVAAVSKKTGANLDAEREVLTVLPSDVVKFVLATPGRWVNGVYEPLDCAPAVIQNRTMLPIRHVGEPLGLVFSWNPEQKLVTVQSGRTVIRLWIGKSRAQLSRNGGQTWVSVPIDSENPNVYPVTLSGRTMVPVRFVTETLGGQVQWDAATRTVTVRS
ncbi:stalk domain-containing protein [Desulforudis sp. DRI-14]|uniref:stalk domain-containing protein n=1 Tax=Desulforudis sp. DRI-14 TaxID=3459793 RepID=UPI004040ED5D